MRFRRPVLVFATLVAACTGGGAALTTSPADDAGDAGPPADAGQDAALVEAGPDAGGDCPAVCPPSSTENFCDNFNRSDPLAVTSGWRLVADNSAGAPTIEATPCGHLVVDSTESVQMLERTLAETVSLVVTFDLTMQITPIADLDAGDAGAPTVVVLALGAADEAIASGSDVTVFYTATQVGVSIGSAVSLANDLPPPGQTRHYTLTVTGRAGNFAATATLSINGGPDIAPAVAQRFTAVPFKVLQLGLRNDSGLGRVNARIDTIGVRSN